MRVNLNLLTQGLGISSASTGNSAGQGSSTVARGMLIANQDTVSISPAGRANSQIEALMKMKRSIIESKNELIGKALEDGKTLEDIRAQLDAYDQQIKTIDNQIAQIMADLAKQSQQSASAKREPEPREETDAEHLNQVARLSEDLERVQKVFATKKRTDGEIRVTRSEIAADRATGGVIASKEKRLEELEQCSAGLSAQMGEGLGKLQQELKNKPAADQTSVEDEGRTKIEPEVQG